MNSRSTSLQAVDDFLRQSDPVSPAGQAVPPAQSPAPTQPALLVPPGGIEIPMESQEKVPKNEPEDTSGVQANPMIANPDGVPTVGNMLTATFNRGFVVEPPTDEERTLFLAALCHNRPVQFDISLCYGAVRMRVRSLPCYRLEDILLAWAEKKLGLRSKDGDKSNVSLADYYTKLQRAYTFMRVMSCSTHTAEGTKQTNYELEKVDEQLLGASSTDAAIDMFDAWMTERSGGLMNHMMFSLMVEAMSVHEQKLTTCLRQAANPNFWRPGRSS